MRHLAAWWFIWFVAGAGSGITGPFETEAGCEKVRKAFDGWFTSQRGSLACISDRAEQDR